MPLRKLQEIIVDYAQHFYMEGRFRALNSSIEYPYDGAAFVFRLNGKNLDFVDNTQELFTLPDGEQLMAPVNHRGFREPKSNQVRGAFLRFQFWEKKIREVWDDDHATETGRMQRELEIITVRLIPLAVEILKPAAESYALREVDSETGQEYWRYTSCDLSYRESMLESGEDVPAEIQVKVEEFNHLLRETEKGIEAIKKDEAQSSPSDLQSALKRTIRLLQEIVLDYARDIDAKLRELSTTTDGYCHSLSFAIEKGQLILAETKRDPAKEAAGSKIHGIESGLHKKRVREITGALLKFALYHREAEKDDRSAVALIKDKLFPLTAKILGYVAKSYSAAVEAKGSTQEHRTCGKVQFVDGEMCADEDLPPALSVKVEEANFLKGKLQQQVYIINPRESSDVQALVQKQIFVPVDLSLRSPFSDLAMAKSRRGDAGQSEILPENDIRKKAINESAVSDQGIDSIQGRGIAEQPHPRSDSNNRRAKSRRPTAHEDPVALERRKAVDAYIKEVLEKTGKRITRADIWKSARYKSRTEFERWQRNDPKATKSANERFTRLLKEKPHLK